MSNKGAAITIKTIDELENIQGLSDLILEKYNENFENDEKIDSINDLDFGEIIDLIQEDWDRSEDEDSEYLYNTYTLVLDKYELCVFGKQWKKERDIICDEEMEDYIQIIDLEQQKVIDDIKNKEKEENKRLKKEENYRNWVDFIDNSTKEQLLEKLTKVNFK